jgi:hypothetical protein
VSDGLGLVNPGRRTTPGLRVEERPVPDRGVVIRPDDLAVLDAETSVTGQALHRTASVPEGACQES